MFQLQSYAKINWFLKIISKRADGYHNIYSLMQKISLCDIIIFERKNKEIKIDCNIEIKDNLVFKVINLLRKYKSCNKGAYIKIIKNIPLKAGLGGGSSNAATVLIGLNRLWRLNLNEKELFILATKIGSDVPFFLSSPLSLVEGKGEVITPIYEDFKSFYLLIVKPYFGVSTSEAYAKVKSFSKKDFFSVYKIIKALKSGFLEEINKLMQNDLEKPVFSLYPKLIKIKERLIDYGAYSALLAGSGSSIFGVFKTFQDTEKAFYELKKHYQCFIASTF